jgi:DNA-binding PadR family transcriptional regulator
MPESFKNGIVERIFRNFLDLMILRLVQIEPMWGYKIIKHVEEQHQIRLRHGALYPLLNKLEKSGLLRSRKETKLLRSRKETKGGRIRKIYEITSKGIQLVEAYNEFLRDELKKNESTKMLQQ